MNVINNDLDESPYYYNLSGTGSFPQIKVIGNNSIIQPGSVSASTLNLTDFGSIIYNTSLTNSFVLKNNGSGDLKITGISLLNASYPAFQIKQAPSLPA